MDKKRLAARVLKTGKSKVWINPANKKELTEAITAQDMRLLIRKCIIKKLPEKKTIAINRKAVKGQGRRKGAGLSRLSSKRKWIIKIRALRAELKDLRDRKMIEKPIYNDLYRKASGGFFRDKSHLKNYLERQELLKGKK